MSYSSSASARGPAPSCSRRVAGARRPLSCRVHPGASPAEDDSRGLGASRRRRRAVPSAAGDAGVGGPPHREGSAGHPTPAAATERRIESWWTSGVHVVRYCRSPTGRTWGLITYDAKDPDTAFPPIEPLRPPAGAPNVLVVLLDDVGFGASSAFGGPCRTPTAERLAARRAEVQPLPHHGAVLADARGAAQRAATTTRSAWAAITEIATSAPGYNSVRPNTVAPLAETLKLNGYSTAQFGKCHEVPVWQTQPDGPVRRVADRRRRLRVLLRLHRRRDQPVLPGALRGHDAGRAARGRPRRATTSPRT